MNETIELSVVIPLRNEEENIPELYERLNRTLTTMDISYEILFTDDGSTDRTYEMLKELRAGDPHLRIIHFARSFGQQSAVTVGFEKARGRVLLVMDGDLQVVPEDIPHFMVKFDEGYEAVVGKRARRYEPLFTRKIPSRLANLFFSRILRIDFQDLGCGMQAFEKRIIRDLASYGNMYNHAAIFALWRGSRVAHIPVQFHARRGGETKWRLSDLMEFFLDIFVTFATEPLYPALLMITAMLCGLLGSMSLFAALASLLVTAWSPLLLFLCSAFLFAFLGVVFIGLAIQSERVSRIHARLDNKPFFVIDEMLESE